MHHVHRIHITQHANTTSMKSRITYVSHNMQIQHPLHASHVYHTIYKCYMQIEHASHASHAYLCAAALKVALALDARFLQPFVRQGVPLKRLPVHVHPSTLRGDGSAQLGAVGERDILERLLLHALLVEVLGTMSLDLPRALVEVVADDVARHA